MQDSVLPRVVGLRKSHTSPVSPPIFPHIFSTLAVLRVALFGVFGVGNIFRVLSNKGSIRS